MGGSPLCFPFIQKIMGEPPMPRYTIQLEWHGTGNIRGGGGC